MKNGKGIKVIIVLVVVIALVVIGGLKIKNVYDGFMDILVVVTGVLFGGKFGVCTLITVIISGPIIQFVNAKAKQVLKI